MRWQRSHGLCGPSVIGLDFPTTFAHESGTVVEREARWLMDVANVNENSMRRWFATAVLLRLFICWEQLMSPHTTPRQQVTPSLLSIDTGKVATAPPAKNQYRPLPTGPLCHIQRGVSRFRPSLIGPVCGGNDSPQMTLQPSLGITTKKSQGEPQLESACMPWLAEIQQESTAVAGWLAPPGVNGINGFHGHVGSVVLT